MLYLFARWSLFQFFVLSFFKDTQAVMVQPVHLFSGCSFWLVPNYCTIEACLCLAFFL